MATPSAKSPSVGLPTRTGASCGVALGSLPKADRGRSGAAGRLGDGKGHFLGMTVVDSGE